MGILDAIIAGVGLAMDAFAVSIGKGLSQKKIILKNMLLIALFFGFFQFAMPVIGFYFCKTFSSYIESFDHWIAFILLVFLGAKMIFECLRESDKEFKLDENKTNKTQLEENEKSNKNEKAETENKLDNISKESEEKQEKKETKKTSNDSKLSIKELIVLAFATSIDALITGVTFAFGKGNIFLSASIIGVITFALSCGGFLIGNFFGSKFKKTAEILGGVVLILLGIKFLLEGYNIIDLGF